MIKESNLIRLPILNENYEPIEYQVQSPIYSLKDFYVLGLYLEKINSIKNRKILSYKNIKGIREEGIIISSMDDIEDIDDNEEIKETLEKNKPIIGYEIYSNNDEIVGIVKDVLIQIHGGKILGFILSEGIFDDLINGYSFLPLVEGIDFNEFKIKIDDKEIVNILPQQGGLKKMLGIYREN